jgi:hypothetical protein
MTSSVRLSTRLTPTLRSSSVLAFQRDPSQSLLKTFEICIGAEIRVGTRVLNLVRAMVPKPRARVNLIIHLDS